jgi:biopolymer transport protein ExbD
MAFKNFEEETPLSEINTTPLVDVCLVLMVIFLVTAPMLTSAIKLELPKEQAGSGMEKEPITVSVTKEGEFYFENNKVSKEELRKNLQEIYAKNPKRQIYIRADSETKYSEVANFIATSSKIGLNNIGFVINNKQ